jgi:hypothetical protein
MWHNRLESLWSIAGDGGTTSDRSGLGRRSELGTKASEHQENKLETITTTTLGTKASEHQENELEMIMI